MIDQRPPELDPDPLTVPDMSEKWRAYLDQPQMIVVQPRDTPPLLTILLVALVSGAVGFILAWSFASHADAASRPAASASPTGAPQGIGVPVGSASLPTEAPRPPARPPQLPSVEPIRPAAAPRTRAGIAAYAARSFGPRYLAIPEGPGVAVTICRGDRCIGRTSNDAGPNLAMQRAGRIADLSYVDFRTLCGCTPELVGTMRVRIIYGGPAATVPPTDLAP